VILCLLDYADGVRAERLEVAAREIGQA